jgi:hypothetical protein
MDADLVQLITLMRIRIKRITLMRIRIKLITLRIWIKLITLIADPDQANHSDADPDQAYHFDADPDQAYSFDADPDPQHRLWFVLINADSRGSHFTLIHANF